MAAARQPTARAIGILTLLRSGGNDYPMEQLKKAGVDLAQPDTVRAVVDQLDDLVTRLERELAESTVRFYRVTGSAGCTRSAGLRSSARFAAVWSEANGTCS